MFHFNRLPLWLYALVILVLIPLAVYEYNTKTKKRYPNHPVKYMIATASIFGIMSCFYGLSQEVALGVVWTRIINVSTIVTGVLFVLSLPFVYYLLIKRNYFTPEALEKLKRTMIPLLAIIIVCGMILIVIWPYATA